MSILFLAHRLPFPPDRGDKIRAHHLLKALAELAPVHVGCFAETKADFEHLPKLDAIAAGHCVPRRSTRVIVPGLKALATGRTVSETAFDSELLRRWVIRTIAEQSVDTVVVFSGQMGQFVPLSFSGKLVVDLCDVDSAKFEAYAAEGNFPRAKIDAREGRLLRQVEADLAARADYTLFVSEEEAGLFRSRLNDPGNAQVRAIRNGIDCDWFDPAKVCATAELVRTPGPHFVFTGQMDYQPNIAACERVVRVLLPRIRDVQREARFHIVGRAPVASLRKLDGKDGVRVWGEVPDVRPFLVGADIMMAPLAIARGVQNKVLEAMAMACPVLLSPQAATGIAARDGEHFAVARSDAALVDRALSMLVNDKAASAMGSAARDYVMHNQSWPAMMAPLGALIGCGPSATQRNAA